MPTYINGRCVSNVARVSNNAAILVPYGTYESRSLVPFQGKGQVTFKGTCTINNKNIKIGDYPIGVINDIIKNDSLNTIFTEDPPAYDNVEVPPPSYGAACPENNGYVKWIAKSYSDVANITMGMSEKIKVNEVLNATNVASNLSAKIEVKNDIVAKNISASISAKISSQNIDAQSVTANICAKIVVKDAVVADHITSSMRAKISSEALHAKIIHVQAYGKIKSNLLRVVYGEVEVSRCGSIKSDKDLNITKSVIKALSGGSIKANLGNFIGCKVKLDHGFLFTDDKLVFEDCEFNISTNQDNAVGSILLGNSFDLPVSVL